MKLQQLLEMPQLTDRELGDDPDDQIEPMRPFFITDQRIKERYQIIGQRDDVYVCIAQDFSSAVIGIKGQRHDRLPGIDVYGDLQFKNPNLGFKVDQLGLANQKVLQVGLVTVVKESQFMGLGTFLYSSLVQAGFTIISDNHQFKGGKELWKKLGRSPLAGTAVYLMNRGEVVSDANGNPIEYNGMNIPDDQIWSADAQHKYILFVYKRR